MRRAITIVLMLICGIAIQAQDEPLIDFALQEEPTILHNEGGRFTDPGAVIAHDGQFHMFRNDFAAFPSEVSVYYHTSDDGQDWELVQIDPIITHEDVPFDVLGAYASSIVIEEDGTWVLYLYTYPDDETQLGAGGSIIRAIASDPLDVWQFDDDPVLMPGDVGAWDAFRVSAPSVIKQEEGYLMFYEGISENFSQRLIGLARSDDGIRWEKHPDPVFTPELDWEADHTHQPRVVDTPMGLIMLYRSYRGRQTSIAFGLASSMDGEVWQRLNNDEPLLAQSRTTGFQPMWYAALAYMDGIFAAPLELRASGGSGTHIHSSTFQLIDTQ